LERVGSLLERVCRDHANAWPGNFLRSASGRCEEIPDCGSQSRRSHPERVRPGHREARCAAILSAIDSSADASRRFVRCRRRRARESPLRGGKAGCAICHVPPLFSEPGWPMHTASEVGIDDFQAARLPTIATAPRLCMASLRGPRAASTTMADSLTLMPSSNITTPLKRLNLGAQEQRELVELLEISLTQPRLVCVFVRTPQESGSPVEARRARYVLFESLLPR
jgi:hypothetical protein